jgi:hypothetical protein
MPSPDQHLRQLVEQASEGADPLAALAALRDMQTLIDERIRVAVRRGLEAGHSFGELALALGISRQAAYRRFRALAPPASTTTMRKLAATDEAYRALRAACDEAIEAGSETLGADHVLIGILRSGGATGRALEQQGVTLQAARAFSRTVPRRGSAPPASLEGVRAVLLAAMRVAATRGEQRVDAHAVLLAALEHPEGGARHILSALGLDPAAVCRHVAAGAR